MSSKVMNGVNNFNMFFLVEDRARLIQIVKGYGTPSFEEDEYFLDKEEQGTENGTKIGLKVNGEQLYFDFDAEGISKKIIHNNKIYHLELDDNAGCLGVYPMSFLIDSYFRKKKVEVMLKAGKEVVVGEMLQESDGRLLVDLLKTLQADVVEKLLNNANKREDDFFLEAIEKSRN